MGICPVGICPVGICPGVFVLESAWTHPFRTPSKSDPEYIRQSFVCSYVGYALTSLKLLCVSYIYETFHNRSLP